MPVNWWCRELWSFEMPRTRRTELPYRSYFSISGIYPFSSPNSASPYKSLELGASSGIPRLQCKCKSSSHAGIFNLHSSVPEVASQTPTLSVTAFHFSPLQLHSRYINCIYLKEQRALVIIPRKYNLRPVATSCKHPA